MAEARVRIRVTGRVQGVSYRAWTARTAGALGLRGFVQNQLDGSVILEAEGPVEALLALRQACAEGPPLARVLGVEVAELDVAATREPGFSVRR